MRELSVVAQQAYPIRAIDVAEQEAELACVTQQGSTNGFVTRWSLNSLRLLTEWPVNEEVTAKSRIALDPPGKYVALTNANKDRIYLWRDNGPAAG